MGKMPLWQVSDSFSETRNNFLFDLITYSMPQYGRTRNVRNTDLELRVGHA